MERHADFPSRLAIYTSVPVWNPGAISNPGQPALLARSRSAIKYQLKEGTGEPVPYKVIGGQGSKVWYLGPGFS